MDKSAIKNFAVGARVKIKEQIEQKAYAFGIIKDEIKKVEIFEDTFEVNGNKYNKRLLKHRESLVKKINEKGFDQVLEEVAYTWFNRLIAIRFMEVNEYLPSGVRVLSSTDSSKAEPDIIREVANLDFENLNIGLIYKLQDENNTEELFKYLLIKQCNELGKIMPVVFEEIEDYTELLLPDNLLQEGSIIRELVASITEEDFQEQVEIIGWLYQYYISEKKDEVFADLKKNIKITKENIPAATQLFTPDWIVKYMVENSLGRLWLESHPDDELKSKWKYYLEEAEQEPEVQKQLEEITNKDIKPEEIKVLDPCMGSGHILVYFFDVLYEIYKSAGYSEREIPKLILTKNLYGLDIDDRAAQLAYFAVMMKARSYNRRIFRERISLNICSIQESNGFIKEAIDLFESNNEQLKEDVDYLINIFNDAKEYGSILEVKEIDFDKIERRIDEIRNGDTVDLFELQYKNVILEKMPGIVKQAKIMSQKYDVVCTNPPYMGNAGMGTKLSEFVKQYYTNSKNDLFAVFMEKCNKFIKGNSFQAMITQQSWMFLSGYEKLRQTISKIDIVNMVHLGANAFEEISGEIVQTTAFVLRNSDIHKYEATFVRLVDYSSQQSKQIAFVKKNRSFYVNKELFNNIPSNSIAYWIPEKSFQHFSKTIGENNKTYAGISTGKNDKFIRLWHEVEYESIKFKDNTNFKFVPHAKGGEFRKWYGNRNYVLKYDENAKKEMVGLPGFRHDGREQYFKYLFSWSKITGGSFSIRFYENIFTFDSAAPVFAFEEPDFYLMGLLNSKVSEFFLDAINPTLNFPPGYIQKLPYIEAFRNDIVKKVIRCIEIVKCDYNLHETSWDFKLHPFLKRYVEKDKQMKLSAVFNICQIETEEAFQQLRSNEEELNRIFIDIYGLQEELTSEVEDKDVTIRKADKVHDIKSFISYAIGCMFGRYSLDEEGLIYAGGEFNQDRYKTFKADIDNVIPITDDEYFEDDIVSRFVEFVKITFSEETLEENLDYIADTIGEKGNETSRQTIRRYFLKDFYKDHLQTYQKRPIYWLFDSGKNDGFKALIYMHRYDIGNVAKVRMDYLHLLQRKYESEINRLDMVMENSNASAREKTEARKKKEKIQKQMLECVQYDQVIAHVANQKISIDLDDGVKVNYDKFQGVSVPQGEGKKPLKADLLAKI